MYNDIQNGPEYKVIGKSVEDCRAQLFQKYGNNYQPVNIGTITKEGFLGFGRKEYVEMKYILRSPVNAASKTSEDSFEKNKSEILSKLGASADNTKQIAKLDAKIDAISDLIESKLNNIQTNKKISSMILVLSLRFFKRTIR